MRAFLARVLDRALNPITRRIAARLDVTRPNLRDIAQKLDRHALLVAEELITRKRALPAASLRDWEFSVFSQFGEDGIIQYLLQHVPIEQRTFVEFGVENYLEANTRFLLMHDNWSGLVIDGSPGNIDAIRQDDIFSRHDLTALCSFITRDNINELISRRFSGDIGLLSVDLDGNDYWIWEAIQAISPRLVICEFNSLFGSERAITVPYRDDFVRSSAHHSHLYFGASLPALCSLATRKGYVFVGCNAAGNDAFFVRQDVARGVPACTARQGYVMSKFRESRDQEGRMTFASGAARLALIAGLPVFDLTQNRLSEITGNENAPAN